MLAHYGVVALPCRVADPDRRGKVESPIAHTQAALKGLRFDLDVRIALSAARLSVDTQLPMVESVVLATARLHQAMLWTQDADFERLRALPPEQDLKIRVLS